MNDENNFDFHWDVDDRVRLGESITYPCKGSMRIENQTNNKHEADDSLQVLCGQDGYFKYPDPWPMCSDDTFCGVPPKAPINGTRIWITGSTDSNSYNSEIYYRFNVFNLFYLNS